MRVRHRRQLPVRGDSASRPLTQNVRHQVPAHGARRRRPGVPAARRRRHHVTDVLRLREAAADLRHGHTTSHTVSAGLYCAIR